METQITNPYASPATPVPFAVDDDLARAFWPLAGRGQRLGAALLDSLFLMIPGLAVLAASSFLTGPTQAAAYIAAGLGALIGNGVQLYFQVRFAQSVGKRCLGIRVVRMDGTTPTLARILVYRNLAPLLVSRIPFAGGVFGLADSIAIFGANSRCLHDHMADTKVVRVQR